ncbi:hypothetical protein HWN40_13235 [Methanolobus zinderi]|uniref:Uncharacterized protein n=1 Tax=Methanolobus zinderi TaxID=536044 RepID=A0A7D5E7Z6_9EURY|nr:hypothetical protein [Methanolobus zinderi]QLC51113.1 hypothetical protein HWN40_13235 [Methanolobus zinderi]
MADLTGFLGNLSEVITSVSGWVVDIMGIFMEPPLIVFVGLGIFGSVAYLVKGMLHR